MCQLQKFIGLYLTGGIVHQGGQTRLVRVEVVGPRQTLGGVGHPQGVFVT